MGRVWMVLGALAGAGAVGLAAAAAHALPQRLDARGLAAMQSAIQMQGWHALALVATGLWVARADAAGALRLGPLAHMLGNLAGCGFTLGLLLFCGAVYANHLGGVQSGPTAPTGGVLLMAGWLLLAASGVAAGAPR